MKLKVNLDQITQVQKKSSVIKYENGQLLYENNEVANRRKEYLGKLYADKTE